MIAKQRVWLAPVVAFVISALVVACAVTTTTAQPPPVRSAARAGTFVPLQIGITHTQVSADPWHDRALVAREKRLLARRRRPQNQHIMGWGVENPQPRPGQYRWAGLDRRIRLIRQTGGTPIITLCCAPDWMKGGTPGRTDWSLLERAPDPGHYDDFADLARRVALRYPDVRYFQVWNEMKGFHDARRNTWDIAAYTRMYNKVYRAVKSARPDAQVGGPYMPIDSWSTARRSSHPSHLRGPWGVVDKRALNAITYWLKHNAGADFIAIDMSTATNDKGLTTDPFAALGKLRAVTRWVHRRTDLPIWIAEWYPLPQRGSFPLRKQDAIMSAGLATMAAEGVSMVLLWGPQRGQPDGCRGCLWTVRKGVPRVTPAFVSSDQIASLLDAGVSSDGVDLRGDVAAVRSGNGVFWVNKTPRGATGRHGANKVRLDPFETRLHALHR